MGITVVFATNHVQFRTYCRWKGLDPEQDAAVIFNSSKEAALNLVEAGQAPVPPEFVVILPGARALKNVRRIVTDGEVE